MTTINPAAVASHLHRYPQFPGHRIEGTDYYAEAVHGQHHVYDLGDFALESGATLTNARLGYKTFGTLSPSGDNAILIPHMYSGTPKAMEVFFGDGRVLDPDHYFIILPGQFGNGISTSPSNRDDLVHGGGFPFISIGDDVRAQYELVTSGLGVRRLQMIIGWSMGAQQAYEWAVRFPGSVERLLPIAGTARTTPHDRLIVRMLEDSITSDPDWANGTYSSAADVAEGIQRHAGNFSVLGVNSPFYRNEVWRNLGFTTLDDFIAGFWQGWFGPMDPNNLLCMLQKWRRGDVTIGSGTDLASTLGSITARTIVIGFRDDLIMPAGTLEAEAALIPQASFRLVDTEWGHFAPMCFADSDRVAFDTAIKNLLSTTTPTPTPTPTPTTQRS